MPHLTLKRCNILTCTYSILCKSNETVVCPSTPIVSKVDDLIIYDFDVRLIAMEQNLKYTVNNKEYEFCVPATDQSLEILYMSCNDVYQKRVWDAISRQHKTKKYNLAIGGGDQLYMDGVWDIPCMNAWKDLSSSQKLAAAVTPDMFDEITKFYKTTYENKWFNSPEYLNVLPNIPAIYMWDDHEIFDGYGSYPDNIMKSEIVKSVYKIARRAFMIYQMHMLPNGLNANLTNFFELNNTLIVNIDTMTERNCKRILSDATRNKIFETMESTSASKIVVLISTALAYYNIDKVRSLLFFNVDKVHTLASYLPSIPAVSILSSLPIFKKLYNVFGLFEYNDDVIDGWCDKNHELETNLFVNKLMELKTTKNKNIAILVGDVHIGGDAVIEKDGVRIPQYISSGVGSITARTAFDCMKKTLSGERFSGGIRYFFDKKTAIFDYNWGRVRIDSNHIIFFHHTSNETKDIIFFKKSE